MTAKSSSSEISKLRAEIRALKVANSQLRSQLTQQKKRPKSHVSTLKRIVVVGLIVISVCLVAAGNILFWAGNTITKTEKYTAAVGPVIEEPAVQAALANYATDQIFSNFNVEGYVQEVLPPRAAFLAPQLSNQIRNQTQSLLEQATASDRFQEAWLQVQTNQHRRLVAIASDYKGDGTINLNAAYNRLSQRLDDTQLAFLAGRDLPPSVGSITVIDAPWLPRFGSLVNNIDTWRLLTLLVLTSCLGIALWLSRHRRQTFYWFSIGTVIAMIVTLIALRVAQQSVVSQVESTYAAATSVTFEILARGLVIQTWLIAGLATFGAVIAWVSGGSRSAVGFRQRVVIAGGSMLHEQLFGQSQHSILLWMQRHKVLLQWSVVATLTAVLLIVRLSVTSVLLYVILMLLLVAVIEVLASNNRAGRK